jgi:hypothetical protein
VDKEIFADLFEGDSRLENHQSEGPFGAYC